MDLCYTFGHGDSDRKSTLKKLPSGRISVGWDEYNRREIGGFSNAEVVPQHRQAGWTHHQPLP